VFKNVVDLCGKLCCYVVFNYMMDSYLKKVRLTYTIPFRGRVIVMQNFKFLSAQGLCDAEIYLEIDRCLPGVIPLYVLRIIKHGSGAIVGQITLQVAHSDLVYYIGHIGYRIHETFRGNNYALKACHLMLELAKRHNMHEIIITCNPDNMASRRTIEKLGGVLKEVVPVPEWHELYEKGDREKCVFVFEVN